MGGGEAGEPGGTEGETDAFGGRKGLVHRFAAASLGTSEGGVRRWVVVCSARRSARVVRGLLRAFLYLSIYLGPRCAFVCVCVCLLYVCVLSSRCLVL